MSAPATTTLHGAQLWIALPDGARSTAPRFDHYAPEPFRVGDATVSVFLGSLAGTTSPVPTFTPLVGAQLDLPGGARLELELDPGFEHGILLDDGVLMVDREPVATDTLAFLSSGRSVVILQAETAVRALLIGGAPLGERIIMWWNFIGRTHDEVMEFRAQWQDHVDGRVGDGLFGEIRNAADPLPAPICPSVRLRDRS